MREMARAGDGGAGRDGGGCEAGETGGGISQGDRKIDGKVRRTVALGGVDQCVIRACSVLVWQNRGGLQGWPQARPSPIPPCPAPPHLRWSPTRLATSSALATQQAREARHPAMRMRGRHPLPTMEITRLSWGMTHTTATRSPPWCALHRITVAFMGEEGGQGDEKADGKQLHFFCPTAPL